MANRKPIEKRISRKDLKFLIRNCSFTEISKDFNVSIGAVKHWCDYYDLPCNKSDIKLFDDLEWEII